MRTGFTTLVNPPTTVGPDWQPEVPEKIRRTHRREAVLLDKVQDAARAGDSEAVIHHAVELVRVRRQRARLQAVNTFAEDGPPISLTDEGPVVIERTDAAQAEFDGRTAA